MSASAPSKNKSKKAKKNATGSEQESQQATQPTFQPGPHYDQHFSPIGNSPSVHFILLFL